MREQGHRGRLPVKPTVRTAAEIAAPRRRRVTGFEHGPAGSAGRYRILARLARGGMADVHLARDRERSGVESLVALKRMAPAIARDPEFLEMFVDEAWLGTRLDHPNLVRVLDAGNQGDERFLAMELVQGESLSSVLRRAARSGKRLPQNLAARLVAQAAAGLHHAHTLRDAAGEPLAVVHRDVSPDNILCAFDGTVKVIDFGVARAAGRLVDTQSRKIKGKFAYMAPEQARGEPVDARTDVFALGVVLWETVTGHRLFRRDNAVATMRAIVDGPYPRPSERRPVPPELEWIVMQAIASRPEDRFQTAQELELALEAHLHAGGHGGRSALARYLEDLVPDRIESWRKAVELALLAPDRDEPASDPVHQSALPAGPLGASMEVSIGSIGSLRDAPTLGLSDPPDVDEPALPEPAGRAPPRPTHEPAVGAPITPGRIAAAAAVGAAIALAVAYLLLC